jgi:glycosyltransferase involved in cell wall biosynthesis
MKVSGNQNILFFQNSILPENGGVPRVSDIITKELIKRGYNCYFVFYDKDNALYSDEFKLKVDLKGNYENFEFAILKFVKEKSIKIIVCQNTYFSSYIRVFKQIKKMFPPVQLFCFLHASPDYWQFSSKEKIALSSKRFIINIFKKIAKKVVFSFYNPYVKTTSALYNLSDKFVLLSESFTDSFLKIYGFEEANNKLFTIPNPLTFNDFSSDVEIGIKQKTVIIVSRLEETQKKIFVALQIWKLLPKETRNTWKLLIVGTGPDEQAYKKYAEDHALHNVYFEGQQTDVIRYYREASIFMMTSIWEGLPMSLLEAQQNGVVPIAFDNFSSLYDVVKDGKSGYIIKQNNVMDFTNKLCNLMENPNLRRQMAYNSVESSKSYHVANIVDKWEQLFSTNQNNRLSVI